VVSSTVGNFGGCASPLTAAQLVTLLNGTVFPAMTITFSTGAVALSTVLVAQEIQSKYLGLRSLVTGRYSYIEILSTYPISNLFGTIDPSTHFYQKFAAYEGPGNTFSSVRTHSGLEPEVVDIVNAGGTSIIGGTTTPHFFLNPYFCFDMILNVQAIARYGIKTTFATEPSKAYMQRDLHNGRSQLDYRLQVEHDVDGQHQRGFLTEPMIDLGIGADQVSAASIRLFATITNVGLADVTTIQQALEAVLPLAGGTLTGLLTINAGVPVGLNLSASRIASVADPVNPQDAATKAYVDMVAAGLDIKPSCVALSDTPGTLATDFKAGDTLDGVVLGLGQRILLTAQADAKENGIWVTTNAAPTRPADFSPTTPNTTGSLVFIEDGTNYHDTQWVMTTYPDPVIDTDANDWTQFAGAGTYVWRDGIDATGMTVDVKVLAPITISGGIGSGGVVMLDYSRLFQLVANVFDVDSGELAGTGLEVGPSIDTYSGPLRIAAAAAGNGLTGGSGFPLAVLANPTNASITVGVAGVSVRYNAAAALTVGASGLAVNSTIAGGGLTWAAGVVAVGAGDGITVNADDVAVNNGNNLGFDGSALVTLGVSSWVSGDSGTVSNVNRQVIIGSSGSQIVSVPQGSIIASESSAMVGPITGEEDVAILASSDVIMWGAMEQVAFVGVYDCDVSFPSAATGTTVRRAIVGGSTTSNLTGDDDSARLYNTAMFACVDGYITASESNINEAAVIASDGSGILADAYTINESAVIASKDSEIDNTSTGASQNVGQCGLFATSNSTIDHGLTSAVVASSYGLVGRGSHDGDIFNSAILASYDVDMGYGNYTGGVHNCAIVASRDGCRVTARSTYDTYSCAIVASDDTCVVDATAGNTNQVLIAASDTATVGDEVTIGLTMLSTYNSVPNNIPRPISGIYDDLPSYSVQGVYNNGEAWALDTVDGDIYCTGALYDGWAPDYAEMFESADGLSIPVGTLVTFDEASPDKIRVGKKGDDYLLGAVSATAGVVLGSASLLWAKKFERTEFGEDIYEDVPDTAWTPKEGEIEEQRPKIRQKKLTKDYDPSKKYIPRVKRSEWHTVGLVGQLLVRCDDKLKARDWVGSDNEGRATRSQERGMGWRCMAIQVPYDADKGYGVALIMVR
jgi:hypothetical protein